MENLESPREPAALQNWLRVIPWPVHLLDSQGGAHRPNSALTRLLGYGDIEMTREQFQRCIPDGMRRRLKAVISSIDSPTTPPYAEISLTYRHRSGVQIEAPRVRVGPLEHSGGPFFVMLVDLTPPEHLTRAEIRSRLTRIISHDLNNVFTISQSYLDLVQRQRVSQIQMEQYLGRAAHAIRRGIYLNEVLHLITADTRLSAEECSVEEILEPLESVITRFLAPGPRWNISWEPDLPELFGHPLELTRFLLDFCIHAYVRWPHTGTLTLEALSARGEDRAVLLRLTPSPDSEDALPVPFQAFLSQQESVSEQNDAPLIFTDILYQDVVSLELADDSMTALLPGD